jgi:hypothetical protein
MTTSTWAGLLQIPPTDTIDGIHVSRRMKLETGSPTLQGKQQ